MPLYEYACEACGHRLEAQQKLSEPALTKCPKCGKKKLQKLISATTFTLKGGGWYKDLYSSQKPSQEPSQKQGSTSSAGESSGTTEGSEGKKAQHDETKAAASSESSASKPSTGDSSSGSSGSLGSKDAPAKKSSTKSPSK